MSVRVEHRIGIAAPPDAIWDLIADIDGWAGWNPLYPVARGRIAVGEALQLTEALPGRPTRPIQPVIVDWEPRNQILWRVSGMMLRCVRYIEIEALSETGCIFANGAFFHGMRGEHEAKSHRRAIFKGYEAMGEAVKQRSEQLWRAQAGRT